MRIQSTLSGCGPGGWGCRGWLCALALLLGHSAAGAEPVAAGLPGENYQEALRRAESLREAFPGQAAPYWILGRIHERFGYRREAAAKAYQRALECKPAPPFASALHGQLGEIALHANAIEQAIHHFEEAIRLAPDSAKLHDRLGLALTHLGRFEEAVAAYKKELIRSPDSALTHYLLAEAYKEQGQLPAAKTHYERAIQLDPALSNALFGLSGVLRKQGDKAGALELLRQFRGLKAKEKAGYIAAVRRVDDERSLVKNLAASCLDFAEAYERFGKPAAACEALERAVAVVPDLAVYRIALANLYRRLGRMDEAIRMCAAACKLDPDDRQYRALHQELLRAIQSP